MQRRAAAAYALFFLVIGIGAYAIKTMTTVPPGRGGGVGAVAVMSLIAAILVIGLSYLPVRG